MGYGHAIKPFQVSLKTGADRKRPTLNLPRWRITFSYFRDRDVTQGVVKISFQGYTPSE